ncbi:GST C-terminal domain-containing protein [Plasmodiophora brassicae]|nr:hypothetical protein PBRA_009120 [Plasmodiophora brassicae]
MVAELYYTPTSCGASNYIAAHKAGLIGSKVNAYQVDLQTHKVTTGPNKDKDFYQINPKGNVPCLVLEDKTILNENAATLQWIADQNPTSELAPAAGTSARYLIQAKLSYISSEVHSLVGPLFNPATPNEVKEWLKAKLKTKYEHLVKHELNNKKYLVGNKFTVADSYLYIVLSWMKYLGVDLGAFPALQAYHDNIAALDFVKSAHAAMAAK